MEASILWSLHEKTRELSGERDNARNNHARCTQARKTTHDLDGLNNNKTWTGLPVEESTRMTEDRDNRESTSMMWPTLGSRTAKEQNRTLYVVGPICMVVVLFSSRWRQCMQYHVIYFRFYHGNYYPRDAVLCTSSQLIIWH